MGLEFFEILLQVLFYLVWFMSELELSGLLGFVAFTDCCLFYSISYHAFHLYDFALKPLYSRLNLCKLLKLLALSQLILLPSQTNHKLSKKPNNLPLLHILPIFTPNFIPHFLRRVDSKKMIKESRLILI